VSIRLLNCHTRNPPKSCISRSTSQSHSLGDSISQRASLFTYHLVRTGYSPVPSSRITLTTPKTLAHSPTDYASSGLGSEHRTAIFAELAIDPIQLTSSRACHRHVTRRAAFHQWELEYKAARTRNSIHLESYGSPLDGAAYQYAISQPPSEVNHPLWSAAVAMEKDERGRKTRRPLFTRRTTSTTFQLAVDHAFTGSYARRFRPNDPPLSLRCPCGFHFRNPNHLIRHCRYFYLHRLSNLIISRGIILSLKTLFSHSVEHSHRLLSFIQQSRAAMRPPEMEARPPPEPD
jgi:hypothetical protein